MNIMARRARGMYQRSRAEIADDISATIEKSHDEIHSGDTERVKQYWHELKLRYLDFRQLYPTELSFPAWVRDIIPDDEDIEILLDRIYSKGTRLIKAYAPALLDRFNAPQWLFVLYLGPLPQNRVVALNRATMHLELEPRPFEDLYDELCRIHLRDTDPLPPGPLTFQCSEFRLCFQPTSDGPDSPGGEPEDTTDDEIQATQDVIEVIDLSTSGSTMDSTRFPTSARSATVALEEPATSSAHESSPGPAHRRSIQSCNAPMSTTDEETNHAHARQSPRLRQSGRGSSPEAPQVAGTLHRDIRTNSNRTLTHNATTARAENTHNNYPTARILVRFRNKLKEMDNEVASTLRADHKLKREYDVIQKEEADARDARKARENALTLFGKSKFVAGARETVQAKGLGIIDELIDSDETLSLLEARIEEHHDKRFKCDVVMAQLFDKSLGVGAAWDADS